MAIAFVITWGSIASLTLVSRGPIVVIAIANMAFVAMVMMVVIMVVMATVSVVFVVLIVIIIIVVIVVVIVVVIIVVLVVLLFGLVLSLYGFSWLLRLSRAWLAKGTEDNAIAIGRSSA